MFKFSYEKLLEHYVYQEQLARRDYSESLALLDREKAPYKKYISGQNTAFDRRFMIETSESGIPLGEVVELNAFIEGQEIRILRQREVVMNHTMIVEQKEEILIAAAKEVKILKKLKEKKIEEHRALIKKIEYKNNDELVVTRFKRGD